MLKIRRRQALTIFSQAILLSFFSGCGSAEVTEKVTYEPPFVPVSFSIATNGTISTTANESIITPLGTFSISANISATISQKNNTLLVVIRHNENNALVDTAYQVQIGQSEVVVVTNGITIIDVTMNRVFIDASSGNIQTIEIKNRDAGTAPSQPTSAKNLTWTDSRPVRDKASNLSPALAVFQNTLYLAYTDTNNSNNLTLVSSTDGVNWTNSLLVEQFSLLPPTLAVFNDTLYLVFVAGDGSSALQFISSTDGRTWTALQQTGQLSKLPSALTVFNNSLYAAFVDSSWLSNGLLLTSSTDGKTWADNQPFTNIASSMSPSLAVFNNTLYMAYIDTSNNNNLLLTSSSDGVNWSGSQEIGQLSSTAPTLAVLNDTLYLAFVAYNGGGNVLLMVSSNDGVNWTDNQPVEGPGDSWTAGSGMQSSPAAPTLAVLNDILYLAFVAYNGNHDLRVISSQG